MQKIYLIGSLRNSRVPEVARELRTIGYEVFDDWYAAGPEADDYWQKYEQDRGHSYIEALNGNAANHVFHYDWTHLNNSDLALMVMPCGKSGWMEFGYMRGLKKPGLVLMEKEPERWDVMIGFANKIFYNLEDLKICVRYYLK